MSYQNLKKAVELAPNCKYYTTSEGKKDEEIREAEKLLDIKFSKQCSYFYKNIGYLSFFGNEIYGIDPVSESGDLEGNSVAYALNDRKQFNLPKEWIPIYNYEDGRMAYLDYSHLNPEKEPRIIIAMYVGQKYELIEVIAEDFGDFLLQLVEVQLRNQ